MNGNWLRFALVLVSPLPNLRRISFRDSRVSVAASLAEEEID
jgi:hypothetical protein